MASSVRAALHPAGLRQELAQRGAHGQAVDARALDVPGHREELQPVGPVDALRRSTTRAPRSTITGTSANVSTEFMSVGRPQRP